MNIQNIISHLFIKRGFLGLLALLWGFMLGGSLLMTAVTYGTALAGVSRFGVTLYQIAVLAMVLPLAWMTMEGEYQEKSIQSLVGFIRLFFIALLFGATMPVLLVVGIYLARQERVSEKTNPSVASRPKRGQPVRFWQDVMGRFFLKLAH